MILGTYNYRGIDIIGLAGHCAIGDPQNHIRFSSVDHAIQWIDEFRADLDTDPKPLTIDELRIVAMDILRENIEDFSKDKDLWYGIRDHDINYHDLDNSGFVQIDIYPLNDQSSFFTV